MTTNVRLKICLQSTLGLLFLFVVGCASEQGRFDTTIASIRRASQRGEIKEALAFYEKEALEAERKASSATWQPDRYLKEAFDAYLAASRAAAITGQLQKRLAYSEKVFDLADKLPRQRERLTAISALANAHRAVRNFDKARELVRQGLEQTQTLPAQSENRYRWERIFFKSLGDDFLRRGDNDAAIEAKRSAVWSGDAYVAAINRHPLATGGNNSLPPSRWNELEGARGSLLNTIVALGRAYLKANKLPEALEQYRLVLKYTTDWRLSYADEGDLFADIGQVYFSQKRYSEALEQYRKALSLVEAQRRPLSIQSVSQRIADVLVATGNTAEAIGFYKRSIQLFEASRSLLQSQELRQSYFEGGLTTYVKLIATLSDSDYGDAFDYSERARSRSFLDLLGNRIPLSRLNSSLIAEEKALQERVASVKVRLVEMEEENTGGDETLQRRELEDAENAYKDFLARVRKENKEQASLMNVEPLTLKEVQNLLEPGQTILEYFVTEAQVFVWVVDKDNLAFQRVALAKNQLAKIIGSVRENISNLGNQQQLSEGSALLYRQLIQPVLSRITGKELIIVPHDVLHYLPFQALVSPAGKYLIEDYPISYLSSASLLQFTQQKRRALGERVLAFGNPDLGDRNRDLGYAEVEAQEVQLAYPSARMYVRREATEEKAKAFSPQNDIIHFASHAELNENDPLSSAILLTKGGNEDGRLEVREIFGMDLKANLVVLSACETGLGKLSSGDELVGLTRAFIYAGTPSVVASLWKVDDSSTAMLMANFYRNLKTMTKVEALRQAQLELIHGSASSELLASRGVGGVGKLGDAPKLKSTSNRGSATVSASHPYFWAPFVLVGDGQ